MDEDLDTYLDQQAAPAEDDLAPIQAEQPVQGYSSPISRDMRDALVLKAYNEAMNPAASPQERAIEGRLSFLGQSGKVPGNNPLVGLGGALAQASKAKADVLLSNPYTSTMNKLDAASRAGTAGMIGTVLDNLANKKRADYQDQLGADIARARALQALHPKGQAAASLAVLNNDQRERQLQANETRKAAAAQAAADAADPESEVSKRYREAAYRTGVYEPGALDGLSMNEIKFGRTASMQTARLDAQGLEADRRASNEDIRKAREKQEDEQRRIADEQRKQQMQREQMQIPGLVWANNHVPTPEQHKVASNLLPAYRSIVAGSRRLDEIQNELQSKWGVASALGQSIGQYAADQETKDLLAEADKLREQQINAARVAYGYGAPQFYELTRLGEQYQRPGDLKTFLTGKASWAANAKVADQEIRGKLRDAGALLPDDPEAYQQGASMVDRDPGAQVQQFARPEIQAYRRRAPAAASLPDVPVTPEKLPAAPVPPVPAVVPAGRYLAKMSSGWTKTPRPLTSEQASKLVAQGIELKAAP